MSFCGAAELAALAATSHGLASFALDDPQWRRLFAAHFFEPPQPHPLAPQYLLPSALSTSAAVCSANSNNDDKEQGPRVQDWPIINPRLTGLRRYSARSHKVGPTLTPAWASGRDWTAGRMTLHQADSPLFPTACHIGASHQVFASWHDCYAYHATVCHARGRIRSLMAGHLLPAHALLALLDQARQELSQESNALRLAGPVTVVGSLHGQFVDLLNLFLINGEPPDTNYLFLGRYVNNGQYGVETASLLLALKVAFPERIHLLRGSHDTRQMTQVYGFMDECLRKYGGGGVGEDVWRAFMDAFDALPLAAVINDKTLCLHSGLSPSLDSIAQFEELDRFQETQAEGPLTDLAWSQPEDVEGWGICRMSAGYLFGPAVTGDWLDKHGLDLLVTTSTVFMEGFKYMHDGRVLVLWSAPNYRDRHQNLAAVLCASDHAAGPHSIVTYDSAPRLPLPLGRELLLRTSPVMDKAQDRSDKKVRGTVLATVALT